MSDAERDTRIRRLYAVEHWSVGTICAQLGVHRDVVRRVLRLDARTPVPVERRRPWAVEDYLPFVGETLQRYPTLTATRLFAMIRERGYTGGATQLRRAQAEVADARGRTEEVRDALSRVRDAELVPAQRERIGRIRERATSGVHAGSEPRR